jgi:hypothetical protein
MTSSIDSTHDWKTTQPNASDSTPASSASKSSCPGCGAALQCENERRIGYIPRNRMLEAEGELPDVLRMDKDFQALLSYVPDPGVMSFSSIFVFTLLFVI